MDGRRGRLGRAGRRGVVYAAVPPVCGVHAARRKQDVQCQPLHPPGCRRRRRPAAGQTAGHRERRPGLRRRRRQRRRLRRRAERSRWAAFARHAARLASQGHPAAVPSPATIQPSTANRNRAHPWPRARPGPCSPLPTPGWPAPSARWSCPPAPSCPSGAPSRGRRRPRRWCTARRGRSASRPAPPWARPGQTAPTSGWRARAARSSRWS